MLTLHKKLTYSLLPLSFALVAAHVQAEPVHYVLDTEGQHIFVVFKTGHLGFSDLLGRFNKMAGDFTYDNEKPENSKISMTVNVGSLDSNHAERDKHLRDKRFLNASKFPEAKFISTSVKEIGKNKYQVNGDFTLHGVTKPITTVVNKIGEGKDPWGGYRAGFETTFNINIKDYGMDFKMPASENVAISVAIEGIRQ